MAQDRVSAEQGRWIASPLYAIIDILALPYYGPLAPIYSIFIAVLTASALSRLRGVRLCVVLILLMLAYCVYPMVVWQSIIAGSQGPGAGGHWDLGFALYFASQLSILYVIRGLYFVLLTAIFYGVPRLWPAPSNDRGSAR